MLGHTRDPELRALYAGAEVFAFPSRHEGFGLPVLEAMVQGTPVVCGDIPALAEVTGGAARLVAPDDVDGWAHALLELLTDAALRPALGRGRSSPGGNVQLGANGQGYPGRLCRSPRRVGSPVSRHRLE